MGHEIFRFDIKQGYGKNYLTGNICTSYELNEAFSRFQPEVVYHMAAMVSRITCEASPGYTAEVNLAGTQNVINQCLKHKSKLIYFSTSEVYGNIGGLLSENVKCEPNNYYGLTKYLGEKLVEYAVTQGLSAVTVRPFMFYDENEDRGVHRSAMIRFVESLIKNEPITVHRGAMRSWMHIDDAVRALEQCAYLQNYEIINIGHPEVIDIAEMASLILTELNKGHDLIKVADLPERMTLTKYPDITKQTTLLGVIPQVSLSEGIKRVINPVKNSIDQSLARRDISAAQHRLSSGDDLGCGI